MRQEAETFRRNLHVASLSDYKKNPNADATSILPQLVFGIPYKPLAVALIANQPILFLNLLQAAVLAPGNSALTPQEQVLSDDFNALFSNPRNYPQFIAATRAAPLQLTPTT